MTPDLRTRRSLLRCCLAGAFPVFAGDSKPVVAVARDPHLRTGLSSPESSRIASLLDRAVQAVYNTDSPLAAWKQIVRPGETVGLKVNCLAGRGASTSPRLVAAICERLQQAGVPAGNIVIWDRLNADLESAGFHPSKASGRIRVLGNDELGYEQDLVVYGAAGSLIATTLARVCDCVISVPVLKDHGIVGVTMALKNFFGAIHNPNKYHTNCGDPYVADVYMLPPIREKVRLHLCDAITAQFEGGPSFMPQWSWPFNGIIASRDPVALDAVGWRIIEAKRMEMKMPSLKAVKREPVYIATAADANHRIGVWAPEKIARVEL
jgi:uncharacterized protein (DUF362 family)